MQQFFKKTVTKKIPCKGGCSFHGLSVHLLADLLKDFLSPLVVTLAPLGLRIRKRLLSEIRAARGQWSQRLQEVSGHSDSD